MSDTSIYLTSIKKTSQMKRTKLFSFRVIAFTLMTLMTFSLFAQSITVNGTVTDDTGMPVIGATVIVVGDATRGTVTDIDGITRFANVPNDGSLRFSYVGMTVQTVPVQGRSGLM